MEKKRTVASRSLIVFHNWNGPKSPHLRGGLIFIINSLALWKEFTTFVFTKR
jgi:hypothetical protein